MFTPVIQYPSITTQTPKISININNSLEHYHRLTRYWFLIRLIRNEVTSFINMRLFAW